MTNASRSSAPAPSERRSFFAQLLAGLVGIAVGLVPLLGGLVVFLSPLGRKSQGGQFVRVTTLAAIPADGVPRRFPVVTAQTDAWTLHPPQPIGSVFMCKTAEQEIPLAFSSVCPHLGCAVNFQPGSDQYLCPCHNSAFHMDGSRVDPVTSPSPRGLDELAVEIRNDQEVWVDYRRFVGGKREKIEE